MLAAVTVRRKSYDPAAVFRQPCCYFISPLLRYALILESAGVGVAMLNALPCPTAVEFPSKCATQVEQWDAQQQQQQQQQQLLVLLILMVGHTVHSIPVGPLY